jgi:hypothetical protein
LCPGHSRATVFGEKIDSGGGAQTPLHPVHAPKSTSRLALVGAIIGRSDAAAIFSDQSIRLIVRFYGLQGNAKRCWSEGVSVTLMIRALGEQK